jgi:hyperosmotically inducible periplasmic protein
VGGIASGKRNARIFAALASSIEHLTYEGEIMNTKLLATLVIAALSVPAMSYAQDKKPMTEKVKEKTEKVKENIKDSVITTKIKAEYAKDKEVSALKIHVDTDDKGVVTLSGNAKSSAEADKAVMIAKKTEGVVSVTNNIKVQAKK